MLKKVVTGLILCVGLCAPVFAQNLEASLNIPALIKQCGENQRQMDKRVFEYSFTSREISRGLDKNGKPTKEVTRVFETFARNQGSSKIALSKDGKNISAKDVEKQRRKAGKQLEKDEQERSQETTEREFGIGIEQTDTKKIFFKIYNFLRADEFFNPRRENKNGRETIVLDFKPRANLPELPPTISSMKFLNGRVWIDAADKVVVRLEALEAANPNGERQPQIVMEYKLLPQGIWLLGGAHVSTLANPALFNNVVIDWKFENINYQHYATDVKEITTVDSTNR